MPRKIQEGVEEEVLVESRKKIRSVNLKETLNGRKRKGGISSHQSIS